MDSCDLAPAAVECGCLNGCEAACTAAAESEGAAWAAKQAVQCEGVAPDAAAAASDAEGESVTFREGGMPAQVNAFEDERDGWKAEGSSALLIYEAAQSPPEPAEPTDAGEMGESGGGRPPTSGDTGGVRRRGVASASSCSRPRSATAHDCRSVIDAA